MDLGYTTDTLQLTNENMLLRQTRDKIVQLINCRQGAIGCFEPHILSQD